MRDMIVNALVTRYPEPKFERDLEQTGRTTDMRIKAKLEISKEWCMAAAKREGDAEIGAGLLARDPTCAPRWRHKKRGTIYAELGRGKLQCNSSQSGPNEGDVLVAYMGEDGQIWFRAASEFEDGRFEPVE